MDRSLVKIYKTKFSKLSSMRLHMPEYAGPPDSGGTQLIF